MNIKRTIFWIGFVIVLGLIIWGVIVSMNKPQLPAGQKLGTPPPVAATDHIRGPDSAPVTLIEYSDFQCPACEAYYSVVQHLLASSTVPIRFVYRHFPLPQHPNANIAAQASEAAGLQGKFWEMFDLVFENHAQWTELDDPHAIFEGYADRIGLNADKFKSDLDSNIVKSLVQSARAAGQDLGIYQTPTFFLNGKMIENPQGYEPFKAAIEASAR